MASFTHSLCFDKSIWQLEEPDEGCIRPTNDVFCFLAGDPRANEQTVTPKLKTKSFIFALSLPPDPGNDAHTLCERAQQDRQGFDQDQPTLGRRDNLPGLKKIWMERTKREVNELRVRVKYSGSRETKPKAVRNWRQTHNLWITSPAAAFESGIYSTLEWGWVAADACGGSSYHALTMTFVASQISKAPVLSFPFIDRLN